MVDISEMNQYHVTKQPKTEEGIDEVYNPVRKNIELVPSINPDTTIMCGDLLRCLCWCCLLLSTDANSDCNCCSDGCCDCDCGGCDNCDCDGCDVGGCNC